MYAGILTVHSWLRWVIVIVAVVAVLRAITGWQSRRMWTRIDDRTGLLLTIAVDLQLLLGLLLYFVYSPYTSLAMDDFGNAMKTAGLRYWAVEHVFSAVMGIALVHVGRVRAERHRIPSASIARRPSSSRSPCWRCSRDSVARHAERASSVPR